MRLRMFIVFSLFLVASCTGSPVLSNTPTPGAIPTASPTPTDTSAPPTHTPTETPNLTPTVTLTLTPTPSPDPTETPTPTITPTYSILRARVLVQSNCRYGPGAPYLYKYGLYPESNIEVFGRTDSGSWVLIRAIGGTNPCWVKADQLEIRGDVMTVAPTYIPLPQSPYYGPVWNVSAVRNGDQVTVSWQWTGLRPGDDHASPTYLLEAWVCQGGKLVFMPVGTDSTSVTVVDESGCQEPSHGRVYGVEKHGYTRAAEVSWP